MATVILTRCDRCRAEIAPRGAATASHNADRVALAVVKDPGTRSEQTLDMCGSCKRKLESFMNGQTLEEPP